MRQRSNDKAHIFEMDLTPLISDCDIVISNLKQKLPLLQGLSRQEVKITSTDNNISFLGQRSTFKFDNPRLDYLDNKFISSEELANIFTLREEDVMLEYAISKETSNLMKVVSRQFSIVNFQISFEGDNASISGTTPSKEQYSRIEHDIPIKRPFKGISNIDVAPFLVDHDGDIFLKMYKVQDTVCVNKCKTFVGKIIVIDYRRGQLIEECKLDNSEPDTENSTQGMDSTD